MSDNTTIPMVSEDDILLVIDCIHDMLADEEDSILERHLDILDVIDPGRGQRIKAWLKSHNVNNALDFCFNEVGLINAVKKESRLQPTKSEKLAYEAEANEQPT